MASFFSRRSRAIVLGTAGLAIAGLASACSDADGVHQVLASVGSDTTQSVSAKIATDYNNNVYSNNPDPDEVHNVLAFDGTNPDTVPGDAQCGSITYRTPPGGGEVARPAGSTAGRDALKASVLAGDGCVDVARSSAAPRPVGTGAGQDPASFEYYAFGLDAVGWSTANPNAPANLTQAQLQGIYNCTFTNWNQVGGANGPIKRYWPQAGSGTRSFAQSDLLGFDPTTFSSGSCPAVTLIEENVGDTIQTNGDNATAIYVYSGAVWVAQANHVQPDRRAAQTIHQLNSKSIVRLNGSTWEPSTPNGSDPGAPVAESNVKLVTNPPAYPGVRFVFNVLDNTSPSYTPAKRFWGFTNTSGGTKSPLCSGSAAATITQFGFGTLNNTDGGTHNQAGANCRLYTP
jgi:phosphate transport system substrate-binding protein